MKCVNIKLLDILGCFHYILNAPRIPLKRVSQKWYAFVVSSTNSENPDQTAPM